MHDAAHLLGVLAVALSAAAICGWLAQRIGQPAALGELIAGVPTKKARGSESRGGAAGSRRPLLSSREPRLRRPATAK
jgi:hypothetical protein